MRTMRVTLREAFARVLPNRRRAVRRGTLERFPWRDRQITIYLPPGYDGARSYPMLYMQDGQNLFDDERAFAHRSWRLHEAADAAIGSRAASPMIIVGIDHGRDARIDEYTGNDYGRLLLDEIKPLIDSKYRTAEMAIGGSSLGGLLSLRLGLEHPDIFTALAVMSPSVWWNGRSVLREVEAFHGQRPRIWLDIGWREGREALEDARLLRGHLLARGWTDADLRYYEDRRGDHSEWAWSRRAKMMLEFLFPAYEFGSRDGS
jgi:predicted alpha/beta superfamily hydrolase